MAVKRHGVHWDLTAENSTDAAMRAAENNLKRVNAAGEALARTFRSALVATALVGLTRESARAAMEAEQQQARLNAVLRATGEQAGLTRREMDELADSIADATTFDDESARQGISTLVKFGNIHGDVLREALKLSADLAAFMGTDVSEAAQLLGKALQSPTEGVTALERQFGKLTTAQKENIETLAKQGRGLEAQQAVLDVVRSKVGGTAQEMNTGLKEATSGATKAWNEMLEAFGKTSMIGGTARDILGGIRDVLKDLKGLTEGQDPMKRMFLNLEAMNEELARLQEQANRPTQAQRAGLGQGAAGAAQAAINTRIEELKAQRAGLLQAIRALQLSGDPADMDARDRRARQTGPVVLGGGEIDEASRRRAEEAQRRFLELQARQAPRPMDVEFEEMTKFWASIALDAKGAAEAIRRAEEAERRFLELQAKAAPRPMDVEFEEMEKFWAETSAGIRKVKVETDAVDKSWRDLGFTFQSALEDTILDSEKLSDILKALERDIARIIIRRNITEPLGNAVGGINWGQLFGGGTANSGMDFSAAGLLTMGAPSAKSSAGGGIRINNVYHIDSRSDQASIMAAVDAGMQKTKADIQRSIRSGSNAYTPQ